MKGHKNIVKPLRTRN
ncbi:hypothetical protein ACT7DH_06730 [Bacillus pacificus]